MDFKPDLLINHLQAVIGEVEGKNIAKDGSIAWPICKKLNKIYRLIDELSKLSQADDLGIAEDPDYLYTLLHDVHLEELKEIKENVKKGYYHGRA